MNPLILIRFWREGIIGALLLVVGVQHFALAGEKRHSAKVETRLVQTQAAYDQFAANVRAAQEKAAADNKAHVEAVTRQQEQITSKVESDYASKIADLRRRYDAVRLHTGTATADSGAAGSTGVSGIPEASSGAAEGTAPDSLACALNTEQLRSLIDWNKEQERVR
jgi:hypothetical protein